MSSKDTATLPYCQATGRGVQNYPPPWNAVPAFGHIPFLAL